MSDLIQTVSNIVGILLAMVGVVGTGFFIYGSFLYLSASGAPHQMERGKSAMFTALAGVVLALLDLAEELTLAHLLPKGTFHRR